MRKGILTAKELQNKELKRDTGNWKYQPESLTLYNQEARYEIYLEEITTSAKALDWILQISSKWKPEFDLAGFVEAFKEAVEHRFGNSAQGVFCPFGKSKTVNWRSPGPPGLRKRS
jgi:hypothetical protein